MNTPIKPSALNNYDVIYLVVAFILFRLLLITGLNTVTNGQELASDIVFHDLIIQKPFAILNGTAFHVASYPPFQWVIEWPIFNVFKLHFSKMISYRLLMVTVEFITFTLLITLLKQMEIRRSLGLVISSLFIISPHQYFSSVFFVQEDVISQLFILLGVILLLNNYRKWCITALVIGVLTAKIFFVIPLFYVIFFHSKVTFKQRICSCLLAFTPIFLVYLLIIFQAFENGGEVPIRDFTPDAKYAANYWVILLKSSPESLHIFKNLSLLLTALIQVILISAFLHISIKSKHQWSPLVIFVVPLAFFFATFYQHMPEYLLMLWPVAALLYNTIWQQCLIVAALCISWAPRIFHGLQTVEQHFGTAAKARNEVLAPLMNNIDLDYSSLNHGALVTQTIVFTIFLISLCYKSLKSHNRVNTLQK